VEAVVGQQLMDDPVEVVRRGYDELSLRYRADDAEAGRYAPWIAELLGVLEPRSRVLDVGSGNGVPVARDLCAAGHRVTGVDLSNVQIERARRLVPAATFVRADVTGLSFPAASFDAVVAFYSLIHLPLDAQPAVLRSFATWLVPNGWLVAIAGWTAWTGSEQHWLGGDTTMWWSHADVETYDRWLADAGLSVERREYVPEGGGGHSLFWARRRNGD
jgi:SAM-dependent methyltransferase